MDRQADSSITTKTFILRGYRYYNDVPPTLWIVLEKVENIQNIAGKAEKVLINISSFPTMFSIGPIQNALRLDCISSNRL